jgi:hypothetical protein
MKILKFQEKDSIVSTHMGIQALTFPNTHISTYRKIIPTPLKDIITHTKIWWKISIDGLQLDI